MKYLILISILLSAGNADADTINYNVTKDGRVLMIDKQGFKEWVNEEDVVRYYYEGYNPANKEQTYNENVLKPKYNSPIAQALTGVASSLTFGAADWATKKADPYTYEQRQKYTDSNWHQIGMVIGGVLLLIIVFKLYKIKKLTNK